MSILELFKDWKSREEFTPRSVIFSEQDPADAIYVVLSGEVQLSLHGQTIAKVEAGGLIGEMAMIPSATRNTTATAISDVALARLDREAFRELVDRSSEFSFHAMAALAQRLREVDRYISERIVNR